MWVDGEVRHQKERAQKAEIELVEAHRKSEELEGGMR